MITIEFNKENNELTIKSSKPITDFSKLMDDLGDHDIVQANEIKQNFIAIDGLVYELDDNSIDRISKEGQVSLSLEGTVEELGDLNFIKWYYGD
jgi:carbonic anhydrase